MSRYIDYGPSSPEGDMGRKPSVVHVAMVKRVAATWLAEYARPEYRITVYASSEDMRILPSLLRSFRDQKIRLAGNLTPIPDLGVDQNLDQVTIWSRDREAMIKLDAWLTKRGCDTTGIW